MTKKTMRKQLTKLRRRLARYAGIEARVERVKVRNRNLLKAYHKKSYKLAHVRMKLEYANQEIELLTDYVRLANQTVKQHLTATEKQTFVNAVGSKALEEKMEHIGLKLEDFSTVADDRNGKAFRRG